LKLPTLTGVCYNSGMKIKLTATFFIIFGLTFLGNFLLAAPAQAALELVRSNDFGTVYYLDSRGFRHPFPNQTTYESWYGKDFSKVVTVGNDFLANYPLAKNITIRPGTYLVKVRTAPQVYAIEQGGVLREIQSEGIAEAIYGENWAARVVDVPDVFFGDYSVGQPIVHDYTVPDSILYYDTLTKKYYHKNNGILRPFASDQAVSANHFKLSEALASDRSYYVRQRPIVGLDKNVFNPVATDLADQRDCASKDLKAAILFLADKNYADGEIEKLQTIKKAIPDRFGWVTDGLSNIDIDYPTAIFLDDGYLMKKRNDNTAEVENELINSFYDNNADIFDFIFVFTNFATPSDNTNEIAHFLAVTNKQEGLGKSLLNRAEVYGSTGKLKGIIVMGNINKYHPETVSGLDEVLAVAMHEILHQWAASVKFIDDQGQTSKALLRSPDFGHWSIYAGLVSPLGGSGWINNADGTFTSGLTQIANTNLRQYSQLDLYLMGLIPKQLLTESIFYLEPEKEGEVGNTIKADAKYVTIDQIIKASGEVRCSTD